jgi:predicted ATPase/transcriptional regulator with XRE-family HTH domain
VNTPRLDGAEVTSARILLRSLRELRGVTQQGWAASLGYSVATVRRWEAGEALPTAEAEDSLISLCRERGLFHTYESGPLRGLTLTPELLRSVLAEGRLQLSGRRAPAPAADELAVEPVVEPPLDTSRDARLPVPIASFIGREVELDAISRLLEVARLVTLTGPGGSGKTRIALEVAHALAGPSTAAVTWINLAPLQDPSLVLLTIAQALGVREVASQALLDTVTEFLRQRDRTVILDNFEHLLPAATVVGDLLHSCDGLRVLATSRARLHLYGEHEFPVTTLPVPPEVTEADVSLDELGRCPSVALFVERAAEADPRFGLTQTNAAPVAAICRRLQGLPLALELAAVRIKVLSPEALLRRLADCLDVLVGGARDLPARQQTLRATLDWSYGLLDGDAQKLFRSLGVFAGSCTVEELEALCSSPGSQCPVLDGLEGLVDASLVFQEPQPNGDPRFSMLDSIRQYARERLRAAGEADALCQRHAEFYLSLAEEAEPQLVRSVQAGWFDRLDAEHDDMRAALRWSLENGHTETGLRLASALWRFWETRGYFSEGEQWLGKGLAQRPLTAAVEAKALTAAGSLVCRAGDLPRARRLHTESLRLFRDLGDTAGIARSLSNLGVVADELGDYTEATVLYEESLALRRELGNTWAIAVLLVNLGEVARKQGRLGEARSFITESRQLFEELGDLVGIAVTFNNLGEVARDGGDAAAAVALHQKSYELRRQLGDRLGTARSLDKLARLAFRQEEYARSAELFGQSLLLCKQLGAEHDALESLEGVAELLGACGRTDEAIQLLAATQKLRTATGASVSHSEQAELEHAIAELRNSLDETAFSTAWAEGQSMQLSQAIAFGLASAQATTAQLLVGGEVRRST